VASSSRRKVRWEGHGGEAHGRRVGGSTDSRIGRRKALESMEPQESIVPGGRGNPAGGMTDSSEVPGPEDGRPVALPRERSPSPGHLRVVPAKAERASVRSGKPTA
jgi:hypothetical protein